MKSKKNIKNNIFIILSIAVIIVIFVSISGFTQFPQTKNETVYVNLNLDGSLKEEKTINWINIASTSKDMEKEFIDYGEYTDIKNMVNGIKPKIDGGKIIWPYGAFKSGSLFYEGTSKKELPIDIAIKYALDGTEIKGEELAGKSGKLRIEIRIKNKLKQESNIFYRDYYGVDRIVEEDCYTPLMVQVSLKVDVTKFSDISADGSTKVLAGKEMNISFADFPFPESDFAVEMFGKDIELNAINIIAVPSEIPVSTDLDDTEKSLHEFDDGLISMEDGSADMIDGAEKLNDGLSELKSGSSELVDAISEINNGLGTLSSSNEDISRGFSDIISALSEFSGKSSELVSAANQLSSNIAGIKNGMDQSAGGASSLAANTATLAAGIGDLKNTHSNLVSIAQLLVSSDPANPTYQQLLAIANGEMDAMNSIYGGMQ